MRTRGLYIILALLAGLLLAVGFLEGGSRFGASQVAAAVPQVPLDIFTIQGKVFEGEIGDESSPIPDVIIELWGANHTYPDPGSFITSTTTDINGWYGLSVDDSLAVEYFHIRETNPAGYDSTSATTISGTVRTNDWIEFVIPLQGQDLTGNKFWDNIPISEFTFQGKVFDGMTGDESNALAGVSVELWGGNNHYPDPGDVLFTTTTNLEGWYGLTIDSGLGYEFIPHPGGQSVGLRLHRGNNRFRYCKNR